MSIIERFQEWAGANIQLCGILFVILCVCIVAVSELIHYRRRRGADGGTVVKKTEGYDAETPNVLFVQKDGKEYKILTGDKEFNSYEIGDVYHKKKKRSI